MSKATSGLNFFGQKRKTIDPNKPKVCYFCEKPQTDDTLCYGCGEYVCEKDNHFEGMGNHDVEDHRGEDDE